MSSWVNVSGWVATSSLGRVIDFRSPCLISIPQSRIRDYLQLRSAYISGRGEGQMVRSEAKVRTHIGRMLRNASGLKHLRRRGTVIELLDVWIG